MALSPWSSIHFNKICLFICIVGPIYRQISVKATSFVAILAVFTARRGAYNLHQMDSDDRLKNIVGGQIKARREALKAGAGAEWRLWTQDAVSERLGVDLTTYQRWESGERGMDFRSLVDIGFLFQIPIGYFFEPVDEFSQQEKEPVGASSHSIFEYVKGLETDCLELRSQNEKLRAQLRGAQNSSSKGDYQITPSRPITLHSRKPKPKK